MFIRRNPAQITTGQAEASPWRKEKTKRASEVHMGKVSMGEAVHELEVTIEHACHAFEEVTGAEVDHISIRRKRTRGNPLYVVEIEYLTPESSRKSPRLIHHKSPRLLHKSPQLVHKEPSAA
jgi:hypothetical protein